MTKRTGVEWEEVLTRVMEINGEYRLRDITSAVAADTGDDVQLCKGNVCWLVLGNRSGRFERVSYGVYRRTA